MTLIENSIHVGRRTARDRSESVFRTFRALAILMVAAAPSGAESPLRGEWLTAEGHPVEDRIDMFVKELTFEIQQLFHGERFENIAVAMDGTVLATWGSSSIRV